MARKPKPRADAPPMSDEDGEVRELTQSDLDAMSPAAIAAPALVARAKRRGRPPLDNPKERVTMRIAADTLEHFKSGGRGWQTRICEVLDDHARRARRKKAG